jgi:acyl dehydratase
MPGPPLCFEDFGVDQTFETAARTVTEADVMAFTGLSGDANPLHVDAEFAGRSRFGERIAHGLLGLSMCGGLLSRLQVIDGTAVALVGVEWRFRAPVRFGDTVRARVRVAEKRETRSDEHGVVAFAFALRNQRDELVQEGTQTFLVRCRGR